MREWLHLRRWVTCWSRTSKFVYSIICENFESKIERAVALQIFEHAVTDAPINLSSLVMESLYANLRYCLSLAIFRAKMFPLLASLWSFPISLISPLLSSWLTAHASQAIQGAHAASECNKHVCRRSTTKSEMVNCNLIFPSAAEQMMGRKSRCWIQSTRGKART